MSLHRYTVHKAKEAIAARPKPTLRSRAAFFKPSPLCYLNLNGPWNNVTIKKKRKLMNEILITSKLTHVNISFV